jgi:hypothetical protein
MSLIGSVANYGGKQPNNTQNVKQFVNGLESNAIWVYKKPSSGVKVQTPADSTTTIYIKQNLQIDGSIFNTSDRLLKDNIKDISYEKNQNIFNLNPCEFSFKTDINKTIHYGFIAQEVEKLYPELVKDSDLGYKTVNYIEMVPLILLKMKDMQKEIDELKKLLKK